MARMMISELLVLAGVAFLSSAAGAASLTVTVPDVRSGPGAVRVALYAQPAGFRHEDHAYRVLSVPADHASVSLTFSDLPAGRYAIMAYHDTNDSKSLDLRLGMFPKEPWGLSNDPKVMGPPTFAAAAFDVTEPAKEISVSLHY